MSERLKELIEQAVSYQAKDEALWLKAESITEAYLQQALRDLHHVIEGTDPYALGRIKDCAETSSPDAFN